MSSSYVSVHKKPFVGPGCSPGVFRWPVDRRNAFIHAFHFPIATSLMVLTSKENRQREHTDTSSVGCACEEAAKMESSEVFTRETA